MEKPIRSFVKAISWRIVATLTTVLLVFAFTGNVIISGGVGFAELVMKIVIYYVHERVWNIVDFGRERKVKES
ncbi:MAG: DUF2061 domain-containing protein [Candidatus Bathyarchaeia archaeon]